MSKLKLLLIIFIAMAARLYGEEPEEPGDHGFPPILSVDQSNIKWGSATNGIVPGIFIQTDPVIRAVVFLQVDKQSQSNSSNSLASGYYVEPTNSFCGIIELRDEKGRKVRLLRPQVNSSNMYPASFSFGAAARAFRGRYMAYSGPGGPPKFAVTPQLSMGRLPAFMLTNYFRFEQPGIYQLTVWPKVYGMAATNKDMCKRIDLPPVSVKFKIGDK